MAKSLIPHSGIAGKEDYCGLLLRSHTAGKIADTLLKREVSIQIFRLPGMHIT
ncbi:MAG: hypothetical protein RBT02_05905 [Bacteroidales bacterium]|jgi:hypothetical protein|nr:hypothetical protein [Bacteroidales bacterium]